MFHSSRLQLKRPNSIKMQSFNSHFAHPQGVFGRLAGLVMSLENRERNRQALDWVAPEISDHVLEVGFGPGIAVAELAGRAKTGFVAGIDASAVMVEQGQRRNAPAISAGRVVLKQASVTRIPFAENSFDKVLSINSLPFWDDKQLGLSEICRVLKLGGRLVLVLQPVWAKTDAQVEQTGQDLLADLAGAGFKNLRLVSHPSRPVTFGAIGLK